MRHFLFLGEERDVLGVWTVENTTDATRLQLELGLRYPDLKTFFRSAPTFEALKAEHTEYEFGGLTPDPFLRSARV